MKKGKRMVIRKDFDEDYPGESEEHMRMVADDPNVLFVAKSEEGVIIKGIIVPASSIDNEVGPVIFPGAEEDTVLAAFSKEFVQDMAEKIALIDSEAGQEIAWEMFMQLASEQAGEEYEDNPPNRDFDLN
jgi:hypothetical protein